MRVLLIDGDASVNRSMIPFLKLGGAVVDYTGTGEDAIELVRHYDYDIVLLDLSLPDMDGCEVLRRLRSSRLDTPVLAMSGLMRPQAKVKALTAGADDVISKPFDLNEVQARMQAIVRRSKGYSQPLVQVGPVQLRLDSRDVIVNAKPVALTGKEYAILELLMLRKGMILTKEAFLNHLYGGMDEPEAKIIDVFVCKLRRKLSDAGAPNVIGTVWGRGYTIREHQAHPAAYQQVRQLVPA